MDHIEQEEEEESNLEGRRKELRKKKKRSVCGMWRMGNLSFKYSIPRGFFSTSDCHHMQLEFNI